MALNTDQLSDPIGWNTVFKEAADKYQLKVETGTSDFSESTSFLKEKLVMFTITDNAARRGEELLSLKNRVRGFLKVLGDTCPKIAEHFKVECYIASSNGQKRNSAIRSVRAATDEERQKLGVQFISEQLPLSAQELWEEYQATSTGTRPPRVIIAFRDR